MSDRKDGGPAFPQPVTTAGNTVGDEYGQGGMSLRDYFAVHADVSGIEFRDTWEASRFLNEPAPELTTHEDTLRFAAKVTARLRYLMADAMLEARDWASHE